MNRMKKSLGWFARVAAIAIFAATALLLLAGCGGGDSTATSSSPSKTASITKAELIRKGDAICRKTDTAQQEDVKAYEEKHGEAQNPNDLAKMLAKIAPPPLKAEIDELSALGAPQGEEATVAAFIEGLERALEQVEEDPSSLVSVNEGFFEKPGDLAGKYGFKDCSEPL